MGEGMKLLTDGVPALNLHLTSEQVQKFQDYYQELVSWNQRMNLTAIVERDEVQVKHFLDSLTTCQVLSDAVKASGCLIDIGSGGGFPAIPIKLVCPGMTLALVDSVGKKTTFLEHLVGHLGLSDVEIFTGRAEDLALDPQLRESFDVAVSRGVAPMRIMMELALPYCRIGGSVVTLKKGTIEQEVEASRHAMEVLGGKLREIRRVTLEGLEDDRVLVVVDKVKPTPAKFPRRPGLPAKHPL